MQAVLALLNKPRVRVLLMTLISGAVWFSWAFFVNRAVPEQALLSGLSQGGVSMLTTAFGSTMLEILFIRIGHSGVGRVICVAIVSALSLAAMVAAHVNAGTPNLLLTVLPVFGVVVLYCSSYIYGLHKIQIQYEKDAMAL